MDGGWWCAEKLCLRWQRKEEWAECRPLLRHQKELGDYLEATAAAISFQY